MMAMRTTNALVYLALANQLIHELYPEALTIAEEMSGLPGLASPIAEKGVGLITNLSMGIPRLLD